MKRFNFCRDFFALFEKKRIFAAVFSDTFTTAMRHIIHSLTLAALSSLLLTGHTYAQEDTATTIDLQGQWQFQIDRQDEGKAQQWQSRTRLDDTITLPGSMLTRGKGDRPTVETQWVSSLYDSSFFYSPVMAKYRDPENFKPTFFLTPERHYVGVAWYNRLVALPTAAPKPDCRYLLYLERPHIETTLYVNGHEVGQQNSLCVAHEYDVTDYVKAGDNLLSLRIDNRLSVAPVGQDSHSVTDQTQGDWNGVVGRMELREVPAVRIVQADVYPHLASREAEVRLVVTGNGQPRQAQITLEATSDNTELRHRVAPQPYDVTLTGAVDTLTLTLPMGERMLTWDEFQPAIYDLTARLTTGAQAKAPSAQPAITSTAHTTFGMREFEIRGTMFYCNGREVQLRGTVENCDFPLTGYAPMDVESWMKVFETCRQWGLNHMRFHSYCPPEAAFVAADRVGFYLQPEGPSWPNHGVKLGQRQPIDQLLWDEVEALVRAYGNHPSFCMLACGNEPAGAWVPWVSRFVEHWAAKDSRRVYTGASVGGGWAWQPKSQYHVKAGARGLGEWVNRAPESMSDFSQKIAHYKAKDGEWDIHEPYVSHETGQWCAFPDFREISKYTGPNKARNFEVFRDVLAENGMADRAHQFMMASGKLQALCYKYEIERTLRTPGYAGFQLLSINDYSGQGTALVGVQNVFFEPKGYVDVGQWREFCSEVVPLARIPKFTYKNDETFTAELMVNDHSQQASGLNGQADHALLWTVCDANGAILGRGTERKVNVSLAGVPEAQKLTLRVNVNAPDGQQLGTNHWEFWVYPTDVAIEPGQVYVTDTLDQRALKVLRKGGDVLLCAAGKVRYGDDVVQQWLPVFWNTSWFKMRPPHTTGILVEEQHPAFAQFPTEYHSNLQWWELVNRAQVMQFTEFPADFQPLVQSIDTWFLSRKIGMLFEARVLRGRLMMTTMDLQSDLEHRIVARQMLASLLNYMRSADFAPAHTIEPALISHLFTQKAPAVQMFTTGSPDELKPKLK